MCQRPIREVLFKVSTAVATGRKDSFGLLWSSSVVSGCSLRRSWRCAVGWMRGCDSAQTLLQVTAVQFPALPVSFLSSLQRMMHDLGFLVRSRNNGTTRLLQISIERMLFERGKSRFSCNVVESPRDSDEL